MKHFVWTRIAHETASINKTLLERKPEVHKAAIAYWLEHSRHAYEHQTNGQTPTVVLTYDESLAGLVHGQPWPKYAVLTTAPITEWVCDNVPAGEPVTLTRCDADDSFSIDWLEMLERVLVGRTERTMMLYYWLAEYKADQRLLSRPMRHQCPQFATVYFPSMPKLTYEETARHIPGNPLYGLVGNHGRYPNQPHIEAPGCYALLRITGFNAINRWGTIGRGRIDPQIDINPSGRFLV